MKNKLLTISKIGLLAFTILVSQACQEDYEMVDPPMITDYDDDLDEEVVLQKGLESYFVTQFGEGDMDGTSWDQAMDVAGFRKLLSGSIDLSKSTIYMSQGKYDLWYLPNLHLQDTPSQPDTEPYTPTSVWPSP